MSTVPALVDLRGNPLTQVAGGFGAASHGRDSSYQGASRTSKNIGLWNPARRSVNSEVLRDAPMIRARARDLYRNNPTAKQAVRTLVDGVCGHRLRLVLRPNYKFLGLDNKVATAWARIVEQLWESYAHGSHFNIDAGRRCNFTGIIQDLVHTRFVDGEYLMTVEWDESRPWSTCFRQVDIDRLEQPAHKPDTPGFRGGIELDNYNAPQVYHLREAHPGDDGLIADVDQFSWQSVKRSTPWGRPIVVHSFARDRPEQIRGVSEFASVIQLMKMSEEYAMAELANAAIQAQVAAVITTEMNYADAANVLGADFIPDGKGGNGWSEAAFQHMAATAEYAKEAGVTFDGQKIVHLLPNEKLELVSGGHPSSQYTGYQSHIDKRISAGLGVDPTALSQNYSDVSYSAARMSMAHNWRSYINMRQNVIDHAGMPMFHAWLEEAVSKGVVMMPPGIRVEDFYQVRDHLVRGTFITAGRPMIDPVKERNAQKTALEAKTMTREEICSEGGRDWEEVLEQIAREKDKMDELGIAPDDGMGFVPPPDAGSETANQPGGET